MHNAGRHKCYVVRIGKTTNIFAFKSWPPPPPPTARLRRHRSRSVYNRVHFPFFSSRFALQTMTGRNDRITDFR